MDSLSVIRRWHFREGLSIREIARRTKLSRNTIRKYLANGEVEPVYPTRKTPSKIDDYADVLSSVNAGIRAESQTTSAIYASSTGTWFTWGIVVPTTGSPRSHELGGRSSKKQ